jgi:hypothetical protein
MKKFKFWCKGTSTNKNFNKPGWWAYPNFLLNKYFYGLDIFESPDFEVCQWTGLLDKEGREIYEGDIIRAVERCEDKAPRNFIEEVKIEDCWFGYDWTRYDRECGLAVIGNKFENPELLCK